jgi:hypothetical protein
MSFSLPREPGTGPDRCLPDARFETELPLSYGTFVAVKHSLAREGDHRSELRHKIPFPPGRRSHDENVSRIETFLLLTGVITPRLGLFIDPRTMFV